MIDGSLPQAQQTRQTDGRDGFATLAWLATTATMLGAASILLNGVLGYLV